MNAGLGGPLPIGSIVPVKILGSLALIDEGETDHKIIAIREGDDLFNQVSSMSDLEKIKPGITTRLIHWLKYYKTSDGKPVNTLKSEVPTTATEALALIKEVHESWKKLISGSVANTYGYFLPKSSSAVVNSR